MVAVDDLREHLRSYPVIAAVREEGRLAPALEAGTRTVFLLGGEVGNIAAMVRRVREAGKAVFVHLDLVEGLARDRSAVKFVAEKVGPDGIITTRGHLIRLARAQGLYTLQRVFIMDSVSLHTGISNVKNTGPDAVECLPATMPRILRRLVQQTGLPVIAGGLVQTQQEVEEILAAGAVGTSLSKVDLW